MPTRRFMSAKLVRLPALFDDHFAFAGETWVRLGQPGSSFAGVGGHRNAEMAKLDDAPVILQ